MLTPCHLTTIPIGQGLMTNMCTEGDGDGDDGDGDGMGNEFCWGEEGSRLLSQLKLSAGHLDLLLTTPTAYSHVLN